MNFNGGVYFNEYFRGVREVFSLGIFWNFDFVIEVDVICLNFFINDIYGYDFG